MTGYGKAEGAVGSRKYTVEVRSLNGKNLDLQVRMPSVLKQMETFHRRLIFTNLPRIMLILQIYMEILPIYILKWKITMYKIFKDINIKNWRKN